MARYEEGHGAQPGREADVVAETHADFEIQPVPITGTVSILGAAQTQAKAAEYGAYNTIVLTGTEPAQQILPRDLYRKIAYLTCTGSSAVIWIGSEAQAKATLKLGFNLATGITLTVTHQQPVWIVGNGSAATLSIAVERWEPEA